jgi:hypothetical protein
MPAGGDDMHGAVQTLMAVPPSPRPVIAQPSLHAEHAQDYKMCATDEDRVDQERRPPQGDRMIWDAPLSDISNRLDKRGMHPKCSLLMSR